MIMMKKINNPWVKINTNPFGMWASLKIRCHWVMYGNKHVVGKIYRYFWKKRLTKKIIEVSEKIASKTTGKPTVYSRWPIADIGMVKMDLLEFLC